MIVFKENSETILLQKRLVELEELLTQTKQKLKLEAEYNRQLEAILKEEHPVKKSKIITIKSATKIEFVHVDDIICCDADEVYTHVRLNDNRKITVAKTLSSFETLLEGHDFFRISKSHIINPSYMITLYKDRNQILLQGNITLDIARRRRVEFLKTINY
ncbi:MAG: LytTR family DNA-binding domain-containing protein [Vicingaceae bacterium]|nr:LytTR family DNA-binding domain-containing protein [Vicingaceae bacterium]